MPLSLPGRWYNAHTFGACTPNESNPMLLLKEVFNIIITTETKPPYSALRIDAWLIVLNLCIKHETHMLGCGDGSPRRQRWMMRWGWGVHEGVSIDALEKKQGLKLSVVLYLHIYRVRGLFVFSLWFYSTEHWHQQIQTNLCCGTWPEITGR